MIARGRFAAAQLGVGVTHDPMKLGREMMADAMPMLLVLATSLNYAHFKMIGTSGSLPDGLGFGYGPEAIVEAPFEPGRMVPQHFYDRYFTFNHDDKGCWIAMKSHTPIDKGMETEFQATVGLKGEFVITTRNSHGDIVNQETVQDPQAVISHCTGWICRNFPIATRRVVATYTERLAATMASNRSCTPAWVNRFAAV
ncbi:MAG: hypothetical protein EBQ96_06465 [Proteobacteria bacterium]|nr:hypothetical protein [Pseudomonadota bacterium]